MDEGETAEISKKRARPGGVLAPKRTAGLGKLPEAGRQTVKPSNRQTLTAH